MAPDLVFGKYEIQHRLAIGGMGEVFYALQKGVPGFERPVILKSLLPELAAQDGFIDQFLDEARVAATLNHPNVVSIFEVGQWNGTYYIAMEYIRGRNLAQVLRKAVEQQSYVPPLVAVRIVKDAALGLDHAHRATDGAGQPLNVVHRDISPQNIMVRDDGLTKVVDFGIARASNRATRTATGALKGKLAYMAPEQVLSVDVGPRSDQFALGVVLWELLTHRRLFKADRDIDVVKKVLEEPISLPSALVPVDPAVEAIAMRMLERDAEKRFASCADVAIALDGVLSRATGPEPTPADFMRQLGTDDLVVRVKATPSQSGNFVISLKGTPAGPEQEVLIKTGTSVKPASLATKPSSRTKVIIPIAALVLLAGVAFGISSRTPVEQPAPPVPTPVVVPEPVVVKPPEPTPTEPPPAAVVKPATLRIVTVPPKASLRVDGRPIGETPQDVEVSPESPHYVSIERPGFKRVEQTIEPVAGEIRDVTITLEAIAAPRAKPGKVPEPVATEERKGTGTLTVNTEPWTKVWVDGEPLGSSPVGERKLAAGKHSLQFVNEAANIDVTRTIDLKTGERLKLNLRLP